MVGYPETLAVPKFTIHEPDANVDAVVTLAAITDGWNVVDWIGLSYSAAPTGGQLKIVIGASIVWNLDVTVAGHHFVNFDSRPIWLPIKNVAVTITLTAPGGSVKGKLAVRSR